MERLKWKHVGRNIILGSQKQSIMTFDVDTSQQKCSVTNLTQKRNLLQSPWNHVKRVTPWWRVDLINRSVPIDVLTSWWLKHYVNECTEIPKWDLNNVAPLFSFEEDIFNRDLHMLETDMIDPESQDLSGKNAEEPLRKNLWLFNIRADPNEGLIMHLPFCQQQS